MRQKARAKSPDLPNNDATDQDDTRTPEIGLAPQPGLRRTAMRGGIYLIGRQVVSVLLKFIGVMLITRVLGPEATALTFWRSIYPNMRRCSAWPA